MTASVRQLTVFRLLMKTGSVTETARLMRVSQPAVSQMLRSLEAGLGLELFIRLSGKIVPTDDARGLVNEVERICVQLSAFGSRAEKLRDGRAGHLSVVTIPTLTHFMVPKAVAALRKERPLLKIRIETSEQPTLVHMVKQEQADVGLSSGFRHELSVCKWRIPLGSVHPGIQAGRPLFRSEMTCIGIP